MAATPAGARIIFGKGVMIKSADDPAIGATAFSLIEHFHGTITGPGGASDQRDITVHELPTPESRLRQMAAGLATLGSLDGQFYYDADNDIHKRVRADWENGVARDYEMVLPPGIVAKWGFRATISNFRPQFPMDDYIVSDLSFSISAMDWDKT